MNQSSTPIVGARPSAVERARRALNASECAPEDREIGFLVLKRGSCSVCPADGELACVVFRQGESYEAVYRCARHRAGQVLLNGGF